MVRKKETGINYNGHFSVYTERATINLSCGMHLSKVNTSYSMDRKQLQFDLFCLFLENKNVPTT